MTSHDNEASIRMKIQLVAGDLRINDGHLVNSAYEDVGILF